MIFDTSPTYYFECLTLDVLKHYQQASFWTQQKCRTELHLWNFKLCILFSAKTLQQEQKSCIYQREKQVALSEKLMKRSFSGVREFYVNFIKWQNVLAFWYIIPLYSDDMKNKPWEKFNIFKMQMLLEYRNNWNN